MSYRKWIILRLRSQKFGWNPEILAFKIEKQCWAAWGGPFNTFGVWQRNLRHHFFMGLDPGCPHPLVTVSCSQISLMTGKLLEEMKTWWGDSCLFLYLYFIVAILPRPAAMPTGTWLYESVFGSFPFHSPSLDILMTYGSQSSTQIKPNGLPKFFF